ncbi:hypothetical protein [Haliangium sp.]|uniref:hypothetical protein n=1 Tax=Haliangium sp. TaxID=2663208 RepID=UPI003D0B6A36
MLPILRRIPLILAVAVALLAGCSGDDSPACTDDSCLPDPLDCEAGTQGCVCAAGDRCGISPAGETLACMDGVCQAPACLLGDTGCLCRDGDTCNAGGDVCQNGYCQPDGCLPGEEDCQCLAGGCDPGLICAPSGLCISSKGYEGGACLDNNRCHRGNLCDSELDQCLYCELGSEGCQCTDADTCGAGLRCVADMCIAAHELPPAEPQCYTPCQADLVEADGVTRVCDADGLLLGCIDGRECNQGSCVELGEPKPTCTSDIECPHFQVCLQGGCYANCESHSECPAGMGCYQKACRIPCQSSKDGSNCPADFSCSAPDGENGYCTALAEPDEEDAEDAPPAGGFSVSVETLILSNIHAADQFTLRSDDIHSQTFTVRKLWHTVTEADGHQEHVEAKTDPATGEPLACDPIRGECPLAWLELAYGGASTQEPTFEVTAAPSCGDDCPVVRVSGAADAPGVSWEGELEIVSRSGRATVLVRYAERPEGQWSGTMHYFGNFDDRALDAWRADVQNTGEVRNGLLLRWSAFRRGDISWDELQAVLTSTKSESWNFARVRERCRSINGGDRSSRCYPYSNPQGMKTYVQDIDATPIPSGITELPMAMNLRLVDAGANTGHGACQGAACLSGRIETGATLHYPADPSVTIALQVDPRAGGTIIPVSALTADTVVGGRSLTDQNGACEPGFDKLQVPWLVDGFIADSYPSDQAEGRFRYHCRDSQVPYAGAGDSPALNARLAGGNPVPDGWPRQRSLRLLDGALVNQSQLVLLFEERLDSFVEATDGAPGSGDKETISTYGYILLNRQPANLDPTDEDEDGVADVFEGAPPPTIDRVPPAVTGMQCDAALLEDLGVERGDLQHLVATLIDGTQVPPGAEPLSEGVHYLCEDTGLFDGGPGRQSDRVVCPPGSRVSYFVVDTARVKQADVTAESCQQDQPGTCQETYNRWLSNGVITIVDPFYRCEDPNRAFCDDDRTDLRAGKLFYAPAVPGLRDHLALLPTIADGFRYKTRFTSRTGSEVGFAPQICIPNSNQIPYCYDPAAIEEIRARVDCLLEIYSDPALEAQPDLDATRADLYRFLRGSFSEHVGQQSVMDGFERLYAELLIMLGDEALTRAFASRFDLAAIGGGSFQGALFEPNGINLSGVAGFEMQKLYQAAQYYQMVLDRLYAMGPDMATALRRGTTDLETNFISPETVVLYLDRVIRASTQKSRALSEAAKRYQNLARPDLARGVIERAYSATYLEGVILSRLMWEIDDRSLSVYQDQIRHTIDEAQRRYRMALLDMRSVYQSITDEVNFFGFSPDYIPFPTLDPNNVRDTNAFEVLMLSAQNKLSFARQREDQAIASDRNVEGDSAAFQAELVRIRNNFEGQLASLCGNFQAEDGHVYPAIKKYADLHPDLTLIGDPCGAVGNGELHEAMGQASVAALDLKKSIQTYDNVESEIAYEEDRVRKQCDLGEEKIDYLYGPDGKQTEIHKLEDNVRGAEFVKDEARQAFNVAAAAIGTGAACGPTSPGACGLDKVIGGIGAATEVFAAGMSLRIRDVQREIDGIERSIGEWEIEHECEVAKVDSNARTLTLALQLSVLNLETLQGIYRLRLAMSQVEQLRGRAIRLQDEQQETEELLIDTEAARNNPNFRIYRNDAIINADIAFRDAVRAAYRTTKVFEYYTSQSYGEAEKLFLIRMIAAGEYNLENYLLDLQNAFIDFEEDFGLPNTRVEILSLRDDILAIPYIDERGNPISEEQRIARLRQKLADVRLLDEHGYLTIPFHTDLDALSPLTRNHKILYMEADVIGARVGDTLGRVYVRQRGTGVVHGVSDAMDYFVFPERTSVLNSFFNGNRVFSPEVYRNGRLRDRPLVNTGWDLTLNMRDEPVNDDIDLKSLSDVRLYVYYTDFTVF